MRERGVYVNDLYAVIAPHLDTMGLTNDVHFGRDGYALLGKTVGNAILAVLAGDAPPQFGAADAPDAIPATASTAPIAAIAPTALKIEHDLAQLATVHNNTSKPQHKRIWQRLTTQLSVYHNTPEPQYTNPAQVFSNALIMQPADHKIMSQSQFQIQHAPITISLAFTASGNANVNVSASAHDHLIEAGWQRHQQGLTINTKQQQQELIIYHIDIDADTIKLPHGKHARDLVTFFIQAKR